MMLEICKCNVVFQWTEFPFTCAFRMFCKRESWERLGVVPGWFHVSFALTLGGGFYCLCSPVFNTCYVSGSNNFFPPQSSADYGFYAYGEVSHFVYCLLQKIKQSGVLPLVEKWEEYMTPNQSKFAAIEADRFLASTRVLSALEKVGSAYLKKEFRRDCRKFLEDFVNSVLSTVAARSAKGQGLSCFCPPVLIGGDDHAPLQLFDLLLDGLLAKGWVRGGDMEACKSEYQSFVQEQRQLERTSTRSRPDVGNVLTFCSSQAGFRVRSHL